MEIQSTTNYDQFSFLEGNRPLNTTHLANLAASIMKKDLLRVNPIVVNTKHEVIDGQHRLFVAKQLHIPIWYVIDEQGSIEDVRILNKYNKIWTTATFLDSYASMGKEDFIWLKEFMQNNGLSFSNTVRFLGQATNSNSLLIASVRNGTLAIPKRIRAEGERRMHIFTIVRQFISIKGHLPPQFIIAFIDAIERGYGEKIVTYFEEKGKTFKPESEMTKAKAQVREWYS